MGLAGNSPDGSAARLRTLARAGGAAIAAFVLIACAALVVLTTVSRRYAQRVSAVNDSLRAIDLLRITVGNYFRQGAFEYVTQDLGYETGRIRLEGDMIVLSERAVGLATDPRQRALLADADRRIADYLLLSRTNDRRAGLTKPLVMSAEAIQNQLRAASLIGFDAVAMSQHKLARWGLLESILGVSIAVLGCFGFVIVAGSLRRLIFAPLLALGEGIDRFAAGDVSARVVPTGPDALRHTAETFNEMAERLARRHEDLLTFLAGVAHDLRNPLAAMRMGVQFLAPGRTTVDEDKERRTLEMIGRQVTRLERMVGDFLDASRIEAGHLELRREPTDVRGLAQEAVQLYADSSLSHHIVLAAPEHAVEVLGDGTRIAQVVNNLVSNAIKYSPRGGDVLVSVATEENEAVLSVQDSGIGIGADDLPYIFEPFRRTGASRETAPGVGLGLSVARRIVEAHGGRMEVQSAIGIGSTFRMRLPLGPTAHAAAAGPLH